MFTKTRMNINVNFICEVNSVISHKYNIILYIDKDMFLLQAERYEFIIYAYLILMQISNIIIT